MRIEPELALAVTGLFLHLVALIWAVAAFVRRMERSIDRKFMEQDKCMHLLHAKQREEIAAHHAENTVRIAVIESKVGDLWDHFRRRKGVSEDDE